GNDGKHRVKGRQSASDRVIVFPHRRRAVVVLPQDVGLLVIVHVAQSDDVPGGSGIEIDEERGKKRRWGAHLPDHHRTVLILEHDVGRPTGVDIRHAFHVPRRINGGQGGDGVKSNQQKG